MIPNNQTPTYGNNVGPQGPQPPQTPVQPPTRRRERTNVLVPNAIFPNWLSKRAIVVYILALGIVTITYQTYCLPWYYLLSGVVSVLVFFIYGSNAAKGLAVERTGEKRFEKGVFWMAFIPRLIWTILIYHLFMEYYGDAFGFDNADAVYYDDLGQFVSGLIGEGNFHFYDEISHWSGSNNISDMGYGIYVGFVYWLSGNSVIAVRLLKCIFSSFAVLLIYRLAKRNFDERTARIAAIFCALWPNFWYYCAVHLKETEMVFLSVLFVEQADQMLKSRQFTVWKVIPVLLIAAAIFSFRTPLGIVALLALVFSVVMSSQKVVSWGKRIIIGGLVVALIGVVAGNQIEEQAQELIETARSDDQHKNMEWRGERKDGNAFAKYAGATVFAPMIFTLPFPTMVKPFEGQDQQQLLNGGNFVKNIISAFTILAMVMLLMSGKWREHLLPLSFILGYLIVLSFSTFAQSERFHQPVMPFELMFAAYGLSIAVTKKKYKRWFTYWCALMFVACFAWNWFKLAGRGLT